jgi:uncharacterized protein (DUF2147 family)
MSLPKFIACIAILSATLSCRADDTDVVGRWLSGNGEGWIEIRLEGDSLIGIAAGSATAKTGDPPRLDVRNPDPALRDRPIDGITIMKGFKYEGDSRWTGGTIYNPNNGKTYKSSVTLVDRNTIKVRGYVGLSLFGKSDTWTRNEK